MNMLAQIQNDNNTDQVTMVSLELVDYINDSRKFDEKPVQLRHADFMAKVPKVLGIETSEKFRSSYLAGNVELTWSRFKCEQNCSYPPVAEIRYRCA